MVPSNLNDAALLSLPELLQSTGRGTVNLKFDIKNVENRDSFDYIDENWIILVFIKKKNELVKHNHIVFHSSHMSINNTATFVPIPLQKKKTDIYNYVTGKCKLIIIS